MTGAHRRTRPNVRPGSADHPCRRHRGRPRPTCPDAGARPGSSTGPPAALAGLPPAQVPPALAKVARFTPAKRAKLAGAALGQSGRRRHRLPRGGHRDSPAGDRPSRRVPADADDASWPPPPTCCGCRRPSSCSSGSPRPARSTRCAAGSPTQERSADAAAQPGGHASPPSATRSAANLAEALPRAAGNWRSCAAGCASRAPGSGPRSSEAARSARGVGGGTMAALRRTWSGPCRGSPRRAEKRHRRPPNGPRRIARALCGRARRSRQRERPLPTGGSICCCRRSRAPWPGSVASWR